MKIVHDFISKLRFTLYKIMPERIIGFEFKRNTGCHLDLKNPKTFNEKIQWLKLYWRDDLAMQCADKYLVREYVKSKGVPEILNELYAVFTNVEEIDFQKLPPQFVMKVTHGCGQNLICTDKTKVDWPKEKKKFKKWLKQSHYTKSLEWVYDIREPRIIVEKLLLSDNKFPDDYKFFCFDGEPKYLFVATERITGHPKFDFFDLEWNHLNVINHYPNSNKKIVKPKKFEMMVEYARKLSKDFPHVRIDLYYVNDKIIFGECTFFHFSGTQPFVPNDLDVKMGQLLTLPKEKK